MNIFTKLKKRKLGLTIIAIVISSLTSHAQDSFYDAIAKFEGVEFQEIYNANPIPDKKGYYKPDGMGRTITLELKKTKAGNYCGVVANEKDKPRGGFLVTDQISDYNTFSYAYPGVVLHKYTAKGYVFTDSMLITLNNVSRDGLSYSSIGRVYWVKLTDEQKTAAIKAKEDEKSKMSVKEKLAAAKDFAKNGAKGSVRYEKFININLDELIKNYLKVMNEKHLAGDPAKEAKIKNDIKMEQEAFLKLRQKQSKEYAAKLNAQKKSGSSKYTIKNNSSTSVQIITGSGSTTTLSAGGSTTYICSTDVYYYVNGNTKGSIIANGDDSCGKTITIE